MRRDLSRRFQLIIHQSCKRGRTRVGRSGGGTRAATEAQDYRWWQRGRNKGDSNGPINTELTRWKQLAPCPRLTTRRRSPWGGSMPAGEDRCWVNCAGLSHMHWSDQAQATSFMQKHCHGLYRRCYGEPSRGCQQGCRGARAGTYEKKSVQYIRQGCSRLSLAVSYFQLVSRPTNRQRGTQRYIWINLC